MQLILAVLAGAVLAPLLVVGAMVLARRGPTRRLGRRLLAGFGVGAGVGVLAVAGPSLAAGDESMWPAALLVGAALGTVVWLGILGWTLWRDPEPEGAAQTPPTPEAESRRG